MPLFAPRGAKMGQDEYRVLNMPRIKLQRSTDQSIPNGVLTGVIFDAPVEPEAWNSDNMWAAITPGRIICKTPGVYLVMAEAGFAVGLGGNYRFGYIAKSGSALRYGADVRVPQAAAQATIRCADAISLNANDFVEFVIYQDSGAALNIDLGAFTSASAKMSATLMSTLG